MAKTVGLTFKKEVAKEETPKKATPKKEVAKEETPDGKVQE